ncbi:hypothetical protein [Mucilaginibacter myungsuensis]|uniref:NACHT domain-containing protein n=1 Tax=Mucilaginibacter myungsuensis TaxID=649104 RepID=A0A929KXT1_9SPHI|nr:hypothetical protein [Mucilaginibacter myungsuensis]MBE9660869.1 hypothetical protein [Mucilaginibacter myungsuensis]MDN3600916.1 hypothetical protein [Mucilaginibacter myungsuensis]
MPYFDPYFFEELKKQILKIAGYTDLIPANCKAISSLIEAKTRQKISETTLKRIFGFAYSKFQPSLFTLDAMSKYCGYRSWNDFCENQEEHTVKPASAVANKNTLSQNAGKITQFTLQALKNKSGIPYYLTINRKFMDDHFDLFLNGPYNATIIAGPAGYGKTIALCHWIDERLALKASKSNDDNILFFSLNALMNVFFTGRDLNEWLLALLGYSADQDISSFLELKQKHKGYFILVIDGLDDHTFRNEQFQLLLSQVMDIFSFYKNYHWFKLVLTMRSATVINYRHVFEYDEPKWFRGFISNNDEVTNVPLFNISEIKRLCNKINPNVSHQVDIDAVKKINYPLYFQFYYKDQREDFSLKKLDQLHMYEVIATFILNKIYLGPNSSEKVLLINAICDKMDMTNRIYTVNKLDLDTEIKQYRSAYQDLLGIGYIKEINNSSNLNYLTAIHFGNNDFLAYTIAKRMLDDNGLAFDTGLVAGISKTFGDDTIKLYILKWCVIYALKSCQSVDLPLLYNAGLSPNEKLDIVVFLSDLFRKELTSSRNSEQANIHYLSAFSSGIFSHFLGLEYISPEYKRSLNSLLNFGLQDRDKILLHTTLAMIAFAELDVNQLEERLSHLRKFSAEDFEAFPVNPLACLETIYYYLKYGIIKKEAFAQLTKFYFNPRHSAYGGLKHANEVLYLLGASTLTICKRPHKIINMINAVKKVYHPKYGDEAPYHFLLNIIKTQAYLGMDKADDGLKLYHRLYETYQEHKKDYTPYMRASFYLLQLQVSIYVGKNQDIYDGIQTLLNLAEQYGFKLIKLNCLISILENRSSLKINNDFYKLLYHDFIKIIRESGFRGESFVGDSTVILNAG